MPPTLRKKDGAGSSGSNKEESSKKSQNELAAEAEATNNNNNNDNGTNNKATTTTRERKIAPPPSALEWSALVGLILLTYFLMPHPLHPPEGQPSIHHVFYYGWLTAVSTGLGIVPLIFAPNLASYWVGVSNGKIFNKEGEVNFMFLLYVFLRLVFLGGMKLLPDVSFLFLVV